MMADAKFSRDQSTLVVDGRRYVTAPAGPDPLNCTGGPVRCAFAQGFGCELFDAAAGRNTRCGKFEREDRQSIIWVRAK